MKTVSILGATGSVGQCTLRFIARHPDRFRLQALVAGRNVAELARLARQYRPQVVSLADPAGIPELKAGLAGLPIEIAATVTEAAAAPADAIVSAIVGAAGLQPTLTAILQGTTVAIANKEALVCAGPLVMAAAQKAGTRLLPIDSEHNAIFQLVQHERRDHLEKIALTASGGPFRNWPREAMQQATPAEALRHPTWQMGPKISIDSATMMNKGLEVIEACHLFRLPESRVEAIVHPQSIVHGLAWFRDGAVLAEMGPTDMTLPIAFALGWPERLQTGLAPLDLAAVGELTFSAIDPERFPCVELARQAFRAGGTAPVILNAANEEAVACFLANRINFGQIPEMIAAALDGLPVNAVNSISDVEAADAMARRVALDYCQRFAA